jgi:hypothetical protein
MKTIEIIVTDLFSPSKIIEAKVLEHKLLKKYPSLLFVSFPANDNDVFYILDSRTGKIAIWVSNTSNHIKITKEMLDRALNNIEKFKDSPSRTELVENMRSKIEERTKLHVEFIDIFGFNPPYRFGFDVVYLDQKLKVPEGMSCTNFISEKYGERANEVVLRLLHLS